MSAPEVRETSSQLYITHPWAIEWPSYHAEKDARLGFERERRGMQHGQDDTLDPLFLPFFWFASVNSAAPIYRVEREQKEKMALIGPFYFCKDGQVADSDLCTILQISHIQASFICFQNEFLQLAIAVGIKVNYAVFWDLGSSWKTNEVMENLQCMKRTVNTGLSALKDE